MAFKKENLTCISNNQKTGVVPALWMYWNEGGDTVTSAGYIPAKYGLSVRDQVLVISANGTLSAFYHVTISDNVVTLTANS